MVTRSSVGAGLLAKASGQSTSMLDETPPSRASPLPHWTESGVEIAIRDNCYSKPICQSRAFPARR
ncbi:hypothetical protein EAH78_00625 [Pseudomonas arsenicoxydans]|uniref:Uncharacterized protein n=1 Tax=Pseudomonas arsenicoxydans TaxID=702115 RepID=A0A502I807_9PSED|nr:hypothetical protein EAH78_00625 [Pseudomonas arsenicoxydans]